MDCLFYFHLDVTRFLELIPSS